MINSRGGQRTGLRGSAGSHDRIEHVRPGAAPTVRLRARAAQIEEPEPAHIENRALTQIRPATMDMVTFAVADLFCAIDLTQVDEVLAMPGVTPQPEYASHMLGAIDLHGTAVPVVDLHCLLGRGPVGIRPDQHLLVLTCASGRLAARCDRVEGLVRTSLQPSSGAESRSGLVLGLVQDADRLRMVLDADALVDARPLPRRSIRTVGKDEVDRV